MIVKIGNCIFKEMEVESSKNDVPNSVYISYKNVGL